MADKTPDSSGTWKGNKPIKKTLRPSPKKGGPSSWGKPPKTPDVSGKWKGNKPLSKKLPKSTYKSPQEIERMKRAAKSEAEHIKRVGGGAPPKGPWEGKVLGGRFVLGRRIFSPSDESPSVRTRGAAQSAGKKAFEGITTKAKIKRKAKKITGAIKTAGKAGVDLAHATTPKVTKTLGKVAKVGGGPLTAAQLVLSIPSSERQDLPAKSLKFSGGKLSKADKPKNYGKGSSPGGGPGKGLKSGSSPAKGGSFSKQPPRKKKDVVVPPKIKTSPEKKSYEPNVVFIDRPPGYKPPGTSPKFTATVEGGWKGSSTNKEVSTPSPKPKSTPKPIPPRKRFRGYTGEDTKAAGQSLQSSVIKENQRLRDLARRGR